MFVTFSWMLIVQARQYQAEGRTVNGVVLTKTFTRATRDSHGQCRKETEYSVTCRFTAADGRVYEGDQDVTSEVWDRLQEREPVSVQYLASSSLVPMLRIVRTNPVEALKAE